MRPEDVKTEHRIGLAWRAPFAVMTAAYRDYRQVGETILDMVKSVPDLPKDFLERGVVKINGEAWPRELWSVLRPRATSEWPICVTLHYPPGKSPGGGGGASTGKTVLSLVAAFALVIITGGIAGGALAPLLGASFAANTIGATALAAAIGIGGALALSALSPPPSLANVGVGAVAGGAQDDTNTDQKRSASASGNVLSPGGSIPRVVGTHLIYPPLISEPFVEIVGDDEVVHAAYALNGPHQLDDIRLNGTAIAEAEDVEFETREGFETDADITLVTRYARTIGPQITLSVHSVDSNTQNLLKHPLDPASDLPVFAQVASPARKTQDEIWVQFSLPNGISINGSTSTDVAIPLRVRFRKRGDSDWNNLPELHLSDSTLQTRRRAILFQWRTRGDVIEPVPTKSGFYYANRNVPGQSIAPATDGWVASSYFTDASGTVDYLNTGSEGTTKITNLCLFDNRVEVYLDEATFPKGVYEIEIKRGTAYKVSSFTAATYTYGGTLQDFFAYSNMTTPTIPESRSNLADIVQLIRVVSVVNASPVNKKGFALIAVKAFNRDVSQLSVLASGLVRDWDGSGWNTWTTTSYPAAHYADILCGYQNAEPMPPDLRDDTGLVAWRTTCITNGWTCDAIIDDFRKQDALTLLASCGYARPYQCEIYGVIVDDDVSGDAPVQIFSRRNSANFHFEKAFARPPKGFLVNFNDRAANYAPAQIQVDQRDASITTSGRYESITYDGLVDEDAVIARALFDLDQANLRSVFYAFDTDVESIVCRKGDLIGFQHDTLNGYGEGVLKSKTVVTGNITTLTLDSTIRIVNEPDCISVTDILSVPDVFELGVTTNIAIRRRDGSITTHALSNATGESAVLTLATPFADTANILGRADTDDTYGCLVVAGTPGETVYRRFKVASIAPTKELQATIVAVDEAPELVRFAA